MAKKALAVFLGVLQLVLRPLPAFAAITSFVTHLRDAGTGPSHSMPHP